jgi:hypothetical protein
MDNQTGSSSYSMNSTKTAIFVCLKASKWKMRRVCTTMDFLSGNLADVRGAMAGRGLEAGQ